MDGLEYVLTYKYDGKEEEKKVFLFKRTHVFLIVQDFHWYIFKYSKGLDFRYSERFVNLAEAYYTVHLAKLEFPGCPGDI